MCEHRISLISKQVKSSPMLNMGDTLATSQFRKRLLVLFGLVLIVYIALTVYEIDIIKYPFKGVHDWIPSDDNSTVISQGFFLYLTNQLRNTPYPGAKNYTDYVLAKSRLKPFFGVKPLRPDFGPVVNDIASFHYPITIAPCQNTVTLRTSIFVAVISAPNHFENRNVIRQTWLSHLKMQSLFGPLMSLAGFGFIVGLTEDQETQSRIEAESGNHSDILQIDKMDAYYNLTQKVVGLLNWMNDNCRLVDFVLKADDDVYVNVQNLAAVISTLDPSEQSVYGTAADGVVQREGKWYISMENWPWSSYPVYTMGAAVLMSGSTIGPLLAASQTTPYFPFDDTYLIGLCTDKAGIKVRFSDRLLGGLTNSLPDPCQVYNTITWITDSVGTLNKSHWATDDFYTNATQCIIKDVNGTSRAADLTVAHEFSFSK